MKKTIRIILSVLLLGVAAVFFCNWWISHSTEKALYDSIKAVPHRHVALVLGTSPIGRNGGPNMYFYSRIDACTALYEAGKVDRILVSGDNRKKTYNEPQAMKEALMERGVPEEAIYLDYAGFRTLDSVVRARDVFGQDSFTVVSQRFHNERAVFIAMQKGIDAIGLNAADVNRHYGFLTRVREYFARCKVFLDLLFGVKPHFLGEPVDID